MFNYKKQLLLIGGMICSPLAAKDFIDNFFEAEKQVMEKAHAGAKEVIKEVDTGIKKAGAGLQKAGKEIKKAGEEVKQAIVTALESKLQITIQENDKDNAIIVTVNGIKATKVDASINEENDTLTITSDSANVIVYAKDRILTVAMRQAIPRKIKTNTTEVQTFNASSMQESRTISSPVMLDKQTINYDQAKEELTIILPKAAPQNAGKPVTVNMITKLDAPKGSEKKADTQAPATIESAKPAGEASVASKPMEIGK